MASVNQNGNDEERLAQQLRDVAIAYRQVEQSIKKATAAAKEFNKVANTNPTDSSTNTSADGSSSKKSSKKSKKFSFSNAMKEQFNGIKEALADKKLFGLKLKTLVPIVASVGAVLGTFGHALNQVRLRFNELAESLVNSKRTINYSIGNTYGDLGSRAGTVTGTKIYETVLETMKADADILGYFGNEAEKALSNFKLFALTLGEADEALKKYNQTIFEAQRADLIASNVTLGISSERSSGYYDTIRALALQYLADTLANELPEKGGLKSAANQTYLAGLPQFEDMMKTLSSIAGGGKGSTGIFTTNGRENWAYEHGYWIPGMDASESFWADINIKYLTDQFGAYLEGGLAGVQEMTNYNKKQTMILDHIGGSLASFDEVEQVSAFSTADTAEEAKKEVKESRLTNEKLDEQIEQWAKQYNLTDKEKQILTDLYNQGFSLTALQSMLDANLNLDEVYNALQAFLDKGGTIEQAEAQLALALAKFPTEIKLSIPKDAKVKIDASQLSNDLATALKSMNGSAVINEDTAEGGSAFLQLLADNGYLDQYTAMSMTRFGWTKSEVEKWYLDYVKQHGTAPVINPELDAELSALDTPEKMWNYYKKNTLFANKNTGVTTSSGTKISAGTSDNVADVTFTMPGGGADAALALRNNIISSAGLTGTVSSPLLESASESTGAQGTGNTFIFNLNGSVYGGDKRIPLEFARQMNDALVDYNKKKGT